MSANLLFLKSAIWHDLFSFIARSPKGTTVKNKKRSCHIVDKNIGAVLPDDASALFSDSDAI